MDIVHEIPWDQGKAEFALWKTKVFASLTAELQARYTAPGQTVRLGGDEVKLRRGLTWGLDVSISLTEKTGEEGKGKDTAGGQAPKEKKELGTVKITVSYGCHAGDRSFPYTIGAGVLAVVATAFYAIRYYYRIGSITDIIVRGAWLIPVIVGLVIVFIADWLIKLFARLLGDPHQRQEYEQLAAEVLSLIGKEALPGGRGKLITPESSS